MNDAFDQRLRQSLGRPNTPEAPPGLDQAVMQRLAARAAPAPVRSPARTLSLYWLAAAVIAIVVLTQLAAPTTLSLKAALLLIAVALLMGLPVVLLARITRVSLVDLIWPSSEIVDR